MSAEDHCFEEDGSFVGEVGEVEVVVDAEEDGADGDVLLVVVDGGVFDLSVGGVFEPVAPFE